MSKVLRNWFDNLEWKQQSVILSGLRGPDNIYCPNIKNLTRWLRNVTQNNADTQHTYMKPEKLPTLAEIEKEFEFTTVHYAFHLLHALEIIGYKHPEQEIAGVAKGYYEGIVKEFLHLVPETEGLLSDRLKDINPEEVN
jgi:hypothetical protein